VTGNLGDGTRFANAVASQRAIELVLPEKVKGRFLRASIRKMEDRKGCWAPSFG
jgi:hypothetical protein